ncbi:hypothetical protein WS83_04385 [Burkholderia sp. MSMB2042]|nr:hypothetical protein WS78_07705 [Burkholderia savannae]KVG49863.1 hypothetical protein WS77_24520 [Burkholderia sp. MSMB0265]KVG83591.1 hypothetical protein WS81_00235 [Burkholderia sp. MSMB2040]KVG94390.1 hypothetical protein WS82_07040 [Burkholderia sp. MSMB2041]KVG95332.1 hypothetical protein WS83_04385 [Burkholderia sp. MSMB2042]
MIAYCGRDGRGGGGPNARAAADVAQALHRAMRRGHRAWRPRSRRRAFEHAGARRFVAHRAERAPCHLFHPATHAARSIGWPA